MGKGVAKEMGRNGNGEALKTARMNENVDWLFLVVGGVV